MSLDFGAIETPMLLAHAVLAALGFGTTLTIDFLFLRYLITGDGLTRQSRKVVRHLVLMVDIGFKGLLATGVLIVATRDLETLFSLTKFPTKMAIFSVLLVNAIIFHKLFLPRLLETDGSMFRHRTVQESAALAIIAGVSSVSWLCCFLIGMQGALINVYTIEQTLLMWALMVVMAASFLFVAMRVAATPLSPGDRFRRKIASRGVARETLLPWERGLIRRSMRTVHGAA